VLCSAEDVRASIERYYHGTLPSEPRVLTDEGLRALAPPLRLSTVAGLVRRLDSFPALPETVHRVHETMNDPNSSVRDVGEIVIMDPPIAAKVLSVANSAAYGFPQRIENISLAITLLGLRETYSIVLSAAVLNVFEKSKHFDYKRFWVEAMCCAAATRFVTKASGRRQLTGAFAAGLLHDIGRVALSEVVPQLYSKIDPGLKDDELLAIEKKTVGLSHTEAGHELALHWGLPHDIAESIRFHHEPAQATRAQELVATVSLADVLAHAAGSSLEDNENLFDGHQDALDILGLDIEIVEAMLDDFLSRRDESLRDAIN